MSTDIAERIANARREAEFLKDKIRESRAVLNDAQRKSGALGPYGESHPEKTKKRWP